MAILGDLSDLVNLSHLLFFHFKETIEEPHQETNSQQKENQSNDIKIEHCVKI